MRSLIESYSVLYEIKLTKPSEEIQKHNDNTYSTKHTKYSADVEAQTPNQYHPNYSGITHSVAWDTAHKKETASKSDKMKSIMDAGHLHNHYIQNNTEHGDIVRNTPTEDDDKQGNKRERIYKRHGFGGYVKSERHDGQYGIVHHDLKTNTKKLHPLEGKDIAAHGEKETAGASDGKVRHYTNHSEDEMQHVTKMNRVIHGKVKHKDGEDDYSDVSSEHPDNEKNLAYAKSHHDNYIKSRTPSKTPTIDRLMSKKKNKIT